MGICSSNDKVNEINIEENNNNNNKITNTTSSNDNKANENIVTNNDQTNNDDNNKKKEDNQAQVDNNKDNNNNDNQTNDNDNVKKEENEVKVADDVKKEDNEANVNNDNNPNNEANENKVDVSDHNVLPYLEEDVKSLFDSFKSKDNDGLDINQFLAFLYDLFQAMGIESESQEEFLDKKYSEMFNEADENKNKLIEWNEFWTPSIRQHVPMSELDCEFVKSQLARQESIKQDETSERTDNILLKNLVGLVYQLFRLYSDDIDRNGLNHFNFCRFVHDLFQILGIEKDCEAAFMKANFAEMFTVADANENRRIEWQEFWRPEIRMYIPDSELEKDIIEMQFYEILEEETRIQQEKRDDNALLLYLNDEVKQVFDHFLQNDDGLTREKFAEFLHELFQAFGIEDEDEKVFIQLKFPAMFEHTDENSDLKIQWEEFWKPQIRVYIPDSELDSQFVREQLLRVIKPSES